MYISLYKYVCFYVYIYNISYMHTHTYIYIYYTLWLFNIAMENHNF